LSFKSEGSTREGFVEAMGCINPKVEDHEAAAIGRRGNSTPVYLGYRQRR
jgi:hypothetical protein